MHNGVVPCSKRALCASKINRLLGMIVVGVVTDMHWAVMEAQETLHSWHDAPHVTQHGSVLGLALLHTDNHDCFARMVIVSTSYSSYESNS